MKLMFHYLRLKKIFGPTKNRIFEKNVLIKSD